MAEPSAAHITEGAAVPVEPEAPKRRPWVSFALRIAISLGLLAFLLRRYGGGAILNLLGRERPAYFAAAVVLYVAGQVMSAWRWQLVAALVWIRGPFREFCAYYFIGMFTNLFIPGLVGGDATRALYLGRRHGHLGAAVASAIADRVIGLLAAFWFAAVAAYLVKDLTSIVTRPVILIGVAAFIAYLAMPLLARLFNLIPHRLARFAKLVVVYMHHPIAIVPALALSLILQASLVVCQYLLALGLGLTIPFSFFMLCVLIANVVASAPITLNGLGLREGTYLVLFEMAGLGRADAVALGLLWFAVMMVGGLAGAVPFVATRLPAPNRATTDRR